MASDTDAKFVHVSASNAQVFVEGILVGNGVSKENATIIGSCLVQADLRGVDTQCDHSLAAPNCFSF